jgi:hypothetical protein
MDRWTDTYQVVLMTSAGIRDSVLLTWKNYEDLRVMDAYTDRIQKQYDYVSNTLVCPLLSLSYGRVP